MSVVLIKNYDDDDDDDDDDVNIIFHVTVILVIYFCDQFMAPKIRHSRCHCSVCQRSTYYSAMGTRF